MYHHEYVWKQLSVTQKSDIKNFWLKENAMPKSEMESRANEVVLLLKNNEGSIIGVTTAYEQYIKLLQHKMLVLRQYVSPKNRKGFIPYKLAKHSINRLEEYYHDKVEAPLGIMVIIENYKMLTINDAVWPRIDLVYIGNTSKGQHMRVRYFKNAKLK